MKLHRQEKLVEKLLKYRLRKFDIDQIKVECYDRYDGDNYMCRVEIFKGGHGIEHRLMKYEAYLADGFIKNVENRLASIVVKTKP